MNLPPEIADAVVKATAAELANRIEVTARVDLGSLDELRLFTIKDVCERLQVTEKTARRLIPEYVELGEASKRITPATLRKIIEQRTIRS